MLFGFTIACVISFIFGIKAHKFMGHTVIEGLKERVQELEEENLLLLARANAVPKSNKGPTPKTNTEQQFTQEDLVVLRNLVHPDKHKNSEKASSMFVKVNELIK